MEIPYKRKRKLALLRPTSLFTFSISIQFVFKGKNIKLFQQVLHSSTSYQGRLVQNRLDRDNRLC
jgi:hypothetical protein